MLHRRADVENESTPTQPTESSERIAAKELGKGHVPQNVSPEEVANAKHIIQYGRPLCVLSISGFVLLHPLTDSQMGLTQGGSGDGLLP